MTAAGAVCGEALAALLGVMLSDPRVTWPAITHVLPAAVAYDVLLCPFVLYAVAAALRLAGARGEGRRAGWSASQARTPVPGANQGAIRQLAGGNSPRLRLSDRDKGPVGRPARAGPAPRPGVSPAQAGPGPQARRARAASLGDGPGAGAAKVRFGGRRREGVLGGSLLGGASPGGLARAAAVPGLRRAGRPRFGSSSMGRSLLGGSVFSRSSSPLGLSSPLGRSSPAIRPVGSFGPVPGPAPRPVARPPFRHRGNLRVRRAAGWPGPLPVLPGGSLARLTGALRRSAGPKSPGRGWLRGASSRGRSPGRPGPQLTGPRRLRPPADGPGRRGWAGAGTPRLRPGHGGPAAHAAAEGQAEMADGRLPMNMASRRRLLVLYVIAAAMLVSLGGRLWYLQVMNNTAFTKLAAANQTRNVIVPAVRGQILDDVGNRLVTNQTALVVSVDMMTLSQQPGGAAPVLHRLAPLLGMSYKLLTDKTRLCTAGVPQPCWAGSPYQPIPVDQNVSDRVALQVMEEQKQFPGVTAQVQPVIDYPQPDGANPAQVLGYLQPITPQEIKSRHLPVTGFSGVDLVGQAGLEAQYDSQLRGKAGTQVVSVNAAGDVTGTVSQTPPVNGDDLVTSLNAQIQADAPERAQRRHRPVAGVAGTPPTRAPRS